MVSGKPDEQALEARREHYQQIAAQLNQRYGEPTWRQHLAPVDELVSTILSQNTNDKNRDKGFYALKDAFSDWESVRDAPPDRIVDLIRPAGLANQKGPRIQSALQHITDEVGEISLDFLTDMSIEDAKAWLTSIKGVGPKTAAIILLFAFHLPAFPVDTHVHRVTKRLGLIDPKVTADQAHDLLEQIVPDEDFYPAHLNLIRHGREVCNARKPRCEQCPLTAYCQYYQEEVVKQHD
jgi:endonuclease III